MRCFEAESPDLVLLDIMMPVMDGFEAARRIKALTRERWTPIIFLSALNRDENLVEGLDAGADDYLTKPINFVVLEAKLRSMQRALAMQQASIDALRRLQTISDNVIDAIISVDAEGLIASANRSAERIFGRTTAEILGQPLTRLIPADAAESIGQEREVNAVRRNGEHFAATLALSEITLDNQPVSIGVIRDISERRKAEEEARENARLLQSHYDQTHNEQQLAMRLMEKQLHRSGLKDKRLHYKVIPAESFSGDIVAAAHSPDGHFYALLADATGHGLAAAISALPVLALFYRMTKMSRPIVEIVQELNQQLKESMPIGRFVAATVVCLDDSSQKGEIWVGGTPDAFLFDRWGRVSKVFESTNLPLGIVNNEEMECNPIRFAWEKESQLVLCSDGLLEAPNHAGTEFGANGLAATAANTSPGARFQAIERALASHLDGGLAPDDVSLMLIDCP